MAAAPLEVQLMVVRWVYRLSQHADIDCATLCACARVCKAWTSTAQRLLLRRLRFDIWFTNYNTRRAILLIRTLRDHPLLATHILSVKFEITRWDIIDLDNPYMALLELCPHIACIYFHCFHVRRGFWTSGEVAGRLHTLALRPAVLRLNSDEEVISDIAHIWPSARVLHLRVWPRTASGDDPILPIRDTSSIEALSVNSDNMHRVLPPEAHFPALRDLELVGPTWESDDLRRRLFGSDILLRVRTLTIKGPAPFPPAEVLERLAHLESLAFDELPEGEEDISLPHALLHVGYHIRDIQIHSYEHAKSARSLVEALRALPNLQRVSATYLSSPHHLAMLDEVCRDRGVELEMYENVEHIWGPQHIDWI
ncbi:hypothetical protein FA95DRAFT_1557220 [Auriscalpium vulgare]|uniref:Uncharacterized protein n=1 Tax=Auriscalpium vulgare TaxID=40419 RepID=A0ACB8RZR0_9AGAM|nr:hypothetical protein FA95DRAFT_1557220 [Auriscalpium vulgare]